jgi:adenylate cyclase
MSGEEVIALIYVYKTNPEARPFDPRDLQLAMGISNQAAMTIQRTNLLKKVRQGDRIRNLFHRFLSSAEADFVLQEYLRTNELPGLTEQILTVVFVDMRDSVALAERLGARRFGDILTLYYHEMAKAVFDNNGLLNKFMGDGLMAVFGALGKPEPERHAVQAALSMLSRMENINRAEDQHIEIGLGVNSGVVAAGYVGSEERVEYTVLGDAVNVAQRLQAQARNQVFVGQETLEVVGQFFHSRPVGPVEIRGRTQPVEVFEILRSTAPLPNLVRA